MSSHNSGQYIELAAGKSSYNFDIPTNYDLHNYENKEVDKSVCIDCCFACTGCMLLVFVLNYVVILSG